MVDDAFHNVLELAIPADILVEVRIHKLVVGVREAREEMTKVQLELNLQIVELWLKTHPSIPPEVREQRATATIAGLQEIRGVVWDCTNMFEEALEVLTTLQEDPKFQCLETKERELQHQYDSVWGTA